eukprot:TRINITY_DN8853_c0_g1_i1.p1 TRINITY_DN8853_c0_g1~~TRINITY_DN8853_c0_g1_i1.p1  ORF type:complete len:150 (+),score=33.32 TRINITY_DN8853_c0_g1_i1:49-450(+)
MNNKRNISTASISWEERQERNDMLNALSEVSMEQTKRRHILYKKFKKQGHSHKEALEKVASHSRKEDGIQQAECPICCTKVLTHRIEEHTQECIEKQEILLQMGFDQKSVNAALKKHEGSTVTELSDYLCDDS